MNTTFHMLAGVAVGAACSRWETRHEIARLGLGFATSVLLHGVMDVTPHSYPISSPLDVALGLAIAASALFLARQAVRPLLVACCLGSVFPDLVDLAPAIINRHTGLSLPTPEFFSWHWRTYSGSMYGGSRNIESWLYHLMVVVIAASSIYILRRRLFRFSF
jgi:hypothetical protein